MSTPRSRARRWTAWLGLSLGLALSFAARPGHANPVTGAWSDVFDWPIVAIHMAQLHTGEILIWSSKNEEPHVLDPTGECFEGNACFTIKPNPVNIFCGGHTHLDDGTILVNGGHVQNHVGEPDTFFFQHDRETDDWSWTQVGELPDTDFARWYPTLTTLPDGRVLNVSGSQKRCLDGPDEGELCIEHTDCAPAENENCTAELVGPPELFDPATGTWRQLSLITESVEFYPFNFVDLDGNVFFAGADDGAGVFDIPPTESAVFDVAGESLMTTGAVSVHDGGSAVMYEPGKILKTGGTNGGSLGIADAEIIDLGGAAVWQATGSMTFPRRRHNLTVLPDGTVLVTGGTRQGNKEFEIERTCGGTDQGDPCNNDEACPVNVTCQKHNVGEQLWVAEAEIWDPGTGDWTPMASSQVPRMYHSTAMLLPDGRVLSAGGGRGGGAVSNYSNAELFSPPYLFTGTPRPEIAEAPEIIHYGRSFEIESPQADDVDRVSLVRLAAVTHSFDQNGRFVPLTFVPWGDTGLRIDAPPGPNLAPPGYYMLFLVSDEGVPSVARFVRLLPADPGAGALYEYSAKVVCGDEPVDVLRRAPGHYATSVNIHNPGPRPVRFFKKLALTYPPGDQRAGPVLPLGVDALGYDEALQTDCRELRRRLVPTSEAPFIEGFLVVQSRGRLDVTAVYTTAVLDEGGAPGAHSSVDVEPVPERGRGSDLSLDKSVVVFPPFAFGDQIRLFPLLYTIEIDNAGPEAAFGLRVEDVLSIQPLNGFGVVTALETPIDLPPGGQIVDITPAADLMSVSFALELGDLAVGDSLAARFWGLALLYQTPGAGAASALVRNVATAGAEGPELAPFNSTDTVESLIP